MQVASRPLKFTTLGLVPPPSNMELLRDCKIWKEAYECILHSDWELGQDDKPFHFDKPTITFSLELCQWLCPSRHTVHFPPGVSSKTPNTGLINGLAFKRSLQGSPVSPYSELRTANNTSKHYNVSGKEDWNSVASCRVRHRLLLDQTASLAHERFSNIFLRWSDI